MKKINSIFTILFLFVTATALFSQERALNVYRGGTVMGRYDVSQIDSMNFVESQEKALQIYRGGAMASKISISKIDSLTFETHFLPSNLHLGVIGFNSGLTQKTIAPLNTDNRSVFTSFINNLASANGTVLYYAVDKAIDALVNAGLPADLVNASIITFTDGLDQGSHMLNGTYQGDNAAYLSALNNRIHGVKIQGIPLSAYSIGIRGNDISDIAQFQSNLRNLASSEENVTEVNNMTEVHVKFQEIAEQIYSQSTETKTTINLRIPGQPNEVKIRFTFDDVSDPANSACYIEGTYRFSDNSLQNVTYDGITTVAGSTVTGTVDGIFVSYTFEDIKQTSGTALPTDYIKQWAYVASSDIWQINSEFTPEANTTTTTTTIRKSAAIMLVLDCSSSLGSQFGTMKTNANNFITSIADNLGPTQPDLPFTFFDYDEGVRINGVTWANCNVDAPGTFAASPASAGMFYQWNRKIGWTNFDPLVNSNDGTTWDGSTPSGTEWTSANNPCPVGWRVPTQSELSSLANAGSVWTSNYNDTGVAGRIFGVSPDAIFLPATGYRNLSDGSLSSQGSYGAYWSSTPTGNDAYYLFFNNGNVYPNYYNYRSYGFPVRCVVEL